MIETGGIYKITNLINGRTYIGCTKNFLSRFSKHFYELERANHVNEELQKDWLAFGANCFSFDIIEEIYSNSLYEKESEYILYYRNVLQCNPYNRIIDGDKNPMFGRHHSEATRATFSEKRMGNKNGIGNKNGLGKFKKLKKSECSYLGVSIRKNVKKSGQVVIKYRAIFHYENARTNLGHYDSPEQAAIAWDDFCYQKFGDSSRLNFPERYSSV